MIKERKQKEREQNLEIMRLRQENLRLRTTPTDGRLDDVSIKRERERERDEDDDDIEEIQPAAKRVATIIDLETGEVPEHTLDNIVVKPEPGTDNNVQGTGASHRVGPVVIELTLWSSTLKMIEQLTSSAMVNFQAQKSANLRLYQKQDRRAKNMSAKSQAVSVSRAVVLSIH